MKRLSLTAVIVAACLIATLLVTSNAATPSKRTNVKALPVPAGADPWNPPAPWVSVWNFGAVPGDGIDDAPAFEASWTNNRYIYIPAGVYDFPNGLVIPDSKRLQGDVTGP